ncbi:multi-sensor hybrid histidine kinase [Candidatus Moduliflexus flocculans]|uniref:histidine kinase n=1 Tax=Candidatus Moduliflexus flocculans TaxID=1499966 RepID=A0A0S6VV20_9BACT|nr:multi-sensor hybrid histidine kinase [Candidatus Moduliflexus flocculans]
MEIIFSPFSQLARYSRAIEGTGLGLALCQRIVRLMGSELSVTSELGQGSAFSFELNLPEARDSQQIPLKASLAAAFSLASSQPLPSQDTLRQLIEYAEIGDILALRKEGERLAQSAELYPFAMQLQQYTNAFQMDKIRDVLTTYLQQGADS